VYQAPKHKICCLVTVRPADIPKFAAMMRPVEYAEIARAESPRGEVVLRERREDGGPAVLELRVNGVFVMDTQETTSERALARAVLALVDEPGTVLVGGLGLGFTMHEVLADPRVRACTVVELEQAIVDWMRDGTIAHGPRMLADERLTVVVQDVAVALQEAAGASYDLVLLDVDNGPGYLVHDANEALYAEPFLTAAHRATGRVLVIWSAAEAPQLAAAMEAVFGNVTGTPYDVQLGSRSEQYWLYSSRRMDPARTASSLGDMTDKGDRVEHDSMGEVRVPADALWRAQTQRAIENFPISGSRLEPRHLHALAAIKAAAASVNARLGVIGEEQATAIRGAAEAVMSGEYDDHFPLDVFQTGSGTSSNMNANEVIASLAARSGVEVHPNDHVNASQSSNDTFPTSIHVAAATAVTEDLQPALDVLASSLEGKAAEFAGLVKSGRTHLMDATPVMLGQEFGGYAATIRLAIERLDGVLPRVRELPLGGTAVGTGINTPPGFAAAVIEELSSITGQPFTEARDHFEAQGTRDSLVELSGVLKTIAVGLTKICNDLRWMSSGPTTGLAEIHLPDLQPGSSIMPGKVNPVLPEATLMVCAQVIGNDTTVTVAGAGGSFELNVMMPVLARALLESVRILSTSTRLLAERCVDGITADAERMRRFAESSPSVVTPLNRYLGYEEAATVAKESLKAGRTIREQVLAMGYVERGVLTLEQLDAALDVEGMTHP
jgi:fumarate hydratase class II